MKLELVTREMFLEAMEAGDVGYCEGDFNVDEMAKHLNAALAPLIAEREAAILEQAASIFDFAARGTIEAMSQEGRSETWKILAQQSVEQYQSVIKSIRAIFPSDALARHDLEIRCNTEIETVEYILKTIKRTGEKGIPGVLVQLLAILREKRLATLPGRTP
jgi:hypothetical protein